MCSLVQFSHGLHAELLRPAGIVPRKRQETEEDISRSVPKPFPEFPMHFLSLPGERLRPLVLAGYRRRQCEVGGVDGDASNVPGLSGQAQGFLQHSGSTLGFAAIKFQRGDCVEHDAYVSSGARRSAQGEALLQ